MVKISSDVWQRLRKGRIISTYDKELRNLQIRNAGPEKLMRIRGIGPRVACNLLKMAGEQYSLKYLDKIYSQISDRTQLEFVKADQKSKTDAKTKPDLTQPIPSAVDSRQRRYIAFLINDNGRLKKLFKLAKKGSGIPYDGSVPHKILHVTVAPPSDILLRDIRAKMSAIAEYEMPSSFEIKSLADFPNVPKAIFLGKFDVACKFIKVPHMTFAEFENEDMHARFCGENKNEIIQFFGTNMQIESLGIVRKGHGLEYAIPIAAFKEEKRAFIPEQIRTFLEFLGHKSPIKYQVFKPSKNNIRQGSGRNTYANGIEEVVNLAAIDNGKGIICVAIGEHGSKQAEDITNISKIHALTIDIDVKKERKAGFVSSHDDHLHAISVAYTIIKKELEKMGFLVGLIDDSGNGAHVFIKVDIDMPQNMTQEAWPKTEVYGRLVAIEQSLRKKLNETGDQIVNIDFLTKDVVRRIKIPGTKNKKDEEQIEDRVCRIIYKASDYAAEKNTRAFLEIAPVKYQQPAENAKAQQAEESTVVIKDAEVERIFQSDEKLNALFNGNIVKHGEDKPLEFKDGKIFCKSRSEAESALVSGLVSHGIRNFKQIDNILMKAKIGKWQEDVRGGYKRTTFQKALKFIRNAKASAFSNSDDMHRFNSRFTGIKTG